ncbi:MAG: ABC transporter substrate-binding protein [Actinomycetaceae bacterium]|nr:ABC transporter substrate-binding protein [Arcanobacterium sp.]MDD7505271.1 ABC transporter substrate-binding protein [Actinomycetaceae bacterium]MDY6144034.1 ABC transporter substrate-binding protein [Arcanobacterium sp.]
MNIKRLVAATAVGMFALSGLAACSDSSNKADDEGNVYFLNWKPEQEEAFKQIAQEYTDSTGVDVKVVTAASGTYEQTLKSEISKSEAPTLFQINGPVGLQSWQKYAADLSDTEFAKALNDPNLALVGEDSKIYGVPLAVEGYGIIYNEEIFDAYFAMDGAKATSMDEINNFAKLKEVADDMQAKKADLGLDGVFASTSLATGEDWRWQTHLANYPVYYEYRDKGVTDEAAVTLDYSENFKNIFDLYLTNSTIEPTLAPSKTVTDSMAEFAQGKAAMVQNGNWAWSQIKDVAGNVVKEDKIKFLPIYTGVDGEETSGIAVGTEAFMAVNAQASEADQKATVDFINWLFLDDAGKKHVVEDLGFIAPFNNYTNADTPADPLAKEVAAYMNDAEKQVVPWVFTTFPSQKFKEDLGQALGQYAAGNMEWDQVKSTFVDGWAAEKGA